MFGPRMPTQLVHAFRSQPQTFPPLRKPESVALKRSHNDGGGLRHALRFCVGCPPAGAADGGRSGAHHAVFHVRKVIRSAQRQRVGRRVGDRLPREVIEIRENQVAVNGQPLALRPLPQNDFSWVPESHHMGNHVYEEDLHWVAFTPGAGEFRNFGPVKLADDEFFLLGDNRDNSLDCRVWGPLKEDAIRGTVILTIATRPRLKRTTRVSPY
jgi:signal peptidase I